MQHGAGDLKCVAFLLGATPVSPKEVFRVHLPEEMPPPKYEESPPQSSTSAKRARRLGLHLFRKMATDEALVDSILRGPRRPTNVYVAVQRNQRQSSGEVMENSLTDSFSSSANSRPSPDLGRLMSSRARVTDFVLKTPSSQSPGPMVLCDDESTIEEEMDSLTFSSPKRSEVRRRSSVMVETPCVSSLFSARLSGEDSNSDLGDEVENMDCEGGDVESMEGWFIILEKLRGFKDPQARLKKNA